MKTYLVTGAAGFIGANYIKYLLHRKYKNEEIKVIVLDLLTYAGNLGTIRMTSTTTVASSCAATSATANLPTGSSLNTI